MTDMINYPPHYKDDSGVECIEVTQWMPFCTGNCFKYLYRAGKKGSMFDDLKKAKWYAERALENNETILQGHKKPTLIKLNEIAYARRANQNIANAMISIGQSQWRSVIQNINAELSHCEIV